jgi:hypothetical protein
LPCLSRTAPSAHRSTRSALPAALLRDFRHWHRSCAAPPLDYASAFRHVTFEVNASITNRAASAIVLPIGPECLLIRLTFHHPRTLSWCVSPLLRCTMPWHSTSKLCFMTCFRKFAFRISALRSALAAVDVAERAVCEKPARCLQQRGVGVQPKFWCSPARSAFRRCRIHVTFGDQPCPGQRDWTGCQVLLLGTCGVGTPAYGDFHPSNQQMSKESSIKAVPTLPTAPVGRMAALMSTGPATSAFNTTSERPMGAAASHVPALGARMPQISQSGGIGADPSLCLCLTASLCLSA